MGYDACRFHGEVDEELLCPICSGVLEDPLQAPQCEHAFCASCIQEWMTRQATCPVDRQPIAHSQLKPVPRILRNLLSRLLISCDNANFGCTEILKLDALTSHKQVCEHNPKRLVTCEQGCGHIIPKDELKDHNCVHDLRVVVQQQQEQLSESKQEIAELKLSQSELRRELQLLRDFMRAMTISSPTVRTIVDQMEQDEIVRWANSLQRARVTRWGGMISTPDAVLQAVIKRSLSESGCPAHIINDLILNAHESRWPPGLRNLETRQINRRQYENYVCRRIPGKQAVAVLLCDNSHMNEDMLLEPGLVLIFAHGIE